ncbi:alkene reductase [Acinetobacter qingfengensis]|uniref:Alkene reductase n=1 Tax=Acinetobacter qingfengensis TaxID=1262585 RepID=A0A1E7QWR7_9GAMM|nr:alkene reductase [Acinetobacter qingfengensis]KAA8731300.1 alkene reductase [Acinetobacter qingfengensis]OEY91451.1 alkene reductase [Acinetobacter qingfengensis]
MADLLDSLKLGDLLLKNRLVLAPLTRSRSGDSRVPNDLNVEYYQQRANAGLILTEATVISPSAVGYAKTPGLYNQQQVYGWKKVVDAVHQQDAKIFVQLWHVGRISDPELLNGETPVSASAIKPAGHVSLLRPKREYVTPRALEINEIQAIVADYKHAAVLAKEAGFDGVELHAANGYLIDQFLQTKTNHREDEYGGSVENRARLLLQVVDAFIEVWGADRVGVHLAPRRDAHDMGDDDPRGTFGYVVEQLSQRHIAFIFAREYQAEDSLSPYLRPKFSGVWIANENLTPESAKKILADGEADAVSFGKAYIANPDLLDRLVKNAPLNELNPETLYADGAEGYTDYPALK